jgi:cell wall-associated NlpC family hydrolase
MAALTESGLRNLNYGDRDSVGFFQMRVGIWNEGAYRGYPANPDLQLQWFLDRAVAVKARHVAAGDAGFGHDPHGWGEWVADVENPDRRYRGRYQEQLDAAHGLLGASAAPAATAAGASAAAPAPVSAAALAADVQAVAPGAAMASAADRAVELAKAYLGDAYVWGGASPQTGFDCSGLVQYVYHQVGIELPRVTDQQFATGQVVGRDELRTGDVVFFRDATGYVHHEGLYLSDGRFLHAPSTGDVVKVSSLDEPYFAQQFAGARRMSASAPAIAESIDMTRRSAGHVAALRPHDARVLPVIDPAAPRPAG